MRYFSQICNKLYNVIVLISLLFTMLIHAQQKTPAPNNAPIPKLNENAQAGSHRDTAKTAAKPKDFVNPCAIPQNTDIIHFPIEKWSSYSDYLKIAQETYGNVSQKVNNAYKYIKRQFNAPSDNDTHSEDNYSDVLEQAAYSQFTLAQLIQKQPNSLIIHEFVTQIYDSRYLHNSAYWNNDTIKKPDQLPNMNSRRPGHLFHLARAQFPNGLPENYADLNGDQKYTLAIIGGVHTLFFLNQLPVIFPSIFNTDFQKINAYPHNYCDNYYGLFDICSPSNYMLTIFKVEKLVAIVNTLLSTLSKKQTEKQVVILAYRDTHDLKPYFSDKVFYKMPLNCVQLKIQ